MGLFVSGNYFSMMGVRTVAGRPLIEEDDERSSPPYAALGQSLLVAGSPIIIVGTALRDFMGTPEVPDLFLAIATLSDLNNTGSPLTPNELARSDRYRSTCAMTPA